LYQNKTQNKEDRLEEIRIKNNKKKMDKYYANKEERLLQKEM
jgi:hypothetical protein